MEGCSAPKFDKASLHAGLVEIFVGKNSKMKYSSVENRSTNTYNLNTKRAIIEEHSYMEWVNGNL
ncbi:MAG: SufD family Fe-S cluster assembly protein [bacterium]